VLGHAQRGGPQERAPPTATRELQALMADMRLDDAEGLEQVGWQQALLRVGGYAHRSLAGKESSWPLHVQERCIILDLCLTVEWFPPPPPGRRWARCPR
jgi:hypothetical protein